MPSPHRQIRISDADWETIGTLAAEDGMSRGAWILRCVQREAATRGVEIALPVRGNPNIAQVAQQVKVKKNVLLSK
jgi:hypothetical protein